MTSRTLALALAALAGAASLASARPNPSYFTDFEGESVPAEWSITRASYTPGLTRFLGNFGSEHAVLTTPLTQGAAYQLAFDFYALDTWDGNSTEWGPDRFLVLIDGAVGFSHTFSNITTYGQSYTGPAFFYLIDQGFGGSGDSGYHLTINFTATGPTTVFNFFASGLQVIHDESWGVDNVAITRVPTPGAGAAMLLAAGLAGGRRRRASR